MPKNRTSACGRMLEHVLPPNVPADTMQGIIVGSLAIGTLTAAIDFTVHYAATYRGMFYWDGRLMDTALMGPFSAYVEPEVIVFGVVVLLAMVVVLMLGYVTLTDVSGSVSSIKRQISDLDEQHVALLTEYEKTFDLATIKAAAEAAGMSKPTSGQIQYIDLSGSDSVTLYKAEGSAGGLLDKAKDGWAYVLEYFR